MNRIIRAGAIVCGPLGLAACILGVVVGVRPGAAATIDGLILESVGCLVLAVAIPAWIESRD